MPRSRAGTRIAWSLTGEEQREAVRALKGSILREEIYADDGTAEAPIPYSVSERNYTVECFQPRGANRYAVFFTHARETIDYHHERNPADPRVTHEAVLQADPFGNVLQSVNAAYGRNLQRSGLQLAPVPGPGVAPDLTQDASTYAQPEQLTALLTLRANSFTNFIDDPGAYRAPTTAETQNYQLTRPVRADDSVIYSFDELNGLAASAAEISYETAPDPAKIQKRLIEDVRTLYRPDDMGAAAGDAKALLPPGQLESLALPGESYTLAFTAGLAAATFINGNANPNKPAAAQLAAIFSPEGGYVNSQGDANWWIPSGRIFYSPNSTDTPAQELANATANFFLECRLVDPFQQITTVAYDSYNRLVAQTQDALGNIVAAQNDYRVLQPVEITDPNGNQIAAAFDALGMVVGTAVQGKVSAGTESGDSFATFIADLAQTDIDGFINNANLLTLAPALLGTATTRVIYDLERFSVTQAANRSDPVGAGLHRHARAGDAYRQRPGGTTEQGAGRFQLFRRAWTRNPEKGPGRTGADRLD